MALFWEKAFSTAFDAPAHADLGDVLPNPGLARVPAHPRAHHAARTNPIPHAFTPCIHFLGHLPHCTPLSPHPQWEDLVSEHYKAKCGGLVPEHRASIDSTHRGLPTPSESILLHMTPSDNHCLIVPYRLPRLPSTHCLSRPLAHPDRQHRRPARRRGVQGPLPQDRPQVSPRGQADPTTR